ncbi:MAG: hypothetical protein CMM46_05575 [Rhodospirillaceae bacterium]|nr:hypothetical protein [Rhodospirillaceae bacterium]
MIDLPIPRNDIDGLCADLDQSGYCLVERWLEPDAVSQAVTAIHRQANQTVPEPDRLADVEDWVIRDGDQWVLLLVLESELDHLITHRPALDLARHLLGQSIHLSGFSAHVVHPGNQVMELHTDQWWLPRPTMPGTEPFRPGDASRSVAYFGSPDPAGHPINPAAVINVMWALTDFSEASGGTRLVPGSHLSGVEPDPSVAWNVVHAEVPAGGAVIWDARTWHASGANTGNSARIGVTATYCAQQFRQLQNHTAAIKPGDYGALSDEMKQLLGFRLFSSYGATDSFEAEFSRPGFLREML